MLFKTLKIDENSKRTASRTAIFNLLFTFLQSGLLIGFVFLIDDFYDDVEAMHVARLVLVEIVLNFLFFPFAIVLVIGIKKDKCKWIRIWIKAKVVQASYLFLLNFVMQVYITASLNFGDGMVVLVYTLIVEVLYMEVIIYMNNYYLHKVAEEESTKLPEKVVPHIVQIDVQNS